MNFIGIIPARFASTRFPGKPLVEINGISMIQRVYQQAQKSTKLTDVVVATDDNRIFDHVNTFGKVVMTSDQHPSGTDRCYEAAGLAFGFNPNPNDVIVNIQGDEPFIEPEQIDLLCTCFIDKSVNIATLKKRITEIEQAGNPNVVKVVTDKNDYALYFSRSIVPFVRGVVMESWIQTTPFFRHIGLYAYRYQTLAALTKTGITSLEKAESLEQLRWLENGYKILVKETEFESFGVDSPEDIAKLPI